MVSADVRIDQLPKYQLPIYICLQSVICIYLFVTLYYNITFTRLTKFHLVKNKLLNN